MLFKLLASPITLPLKGAFKVMETIHDQAIGQFGSADAIRAELVRLEGLLNAGEISEDDFEEAEDQLLDRLEEMQDAEG